MKALSVALLFVAGQAFACPGDKAKDAMAPATSKPVVAAAPAPAATVASTKSTTKVVATKTSTTAEPRKASSL